MQLLFPGFLWGGFAVALPVLVHLLQLRRPRRVFFSNNAFVQEVELKSGRRRIQDWVVLFLRALAVALLVLAFCQPFVPAKEAEIAGRDVVVVLDNSPSMQVAGVDGNWLSQEVSARAGAIGRAYGRETKFQLPLRNAGSLTAATYEQAIEASVGSDVELGWGSGEARRAYAPRQSGPLYVVSDFQKSEIGAEALRQLPTNREILLLPQVAKAVGNLYVDSVWLNDAFVRAGASMGLHIRLRNGGGEAVSDAAVKVQLLGRQVAAYQANVAARATSETVVQVQLPVGVLLMGEVVLDEAGPRFDNRFYFVLSPTASVRVVEVGPEALTQGAYHRESLFQYSFCRPQQVDFGQLQQANLVLLSGPAEVSAGLRNALGAVVRRGGSVAVVPPATAAGQATYGQLLRALGAGAAQWDRNTPVKQELRMPDSQSPFFREVFGVQPRQVTLPEASPVVRVAGGTDLLRLRDGSAFLTEFVEGAGKAYVFSSPFDKEYTDFTTQSLFVPVLYRMALLSYRADQPLAYRVGQEALTLTVPTVASTTGTNEAASYRLVRDSLTLVPGQRQLGRQLRLEVPVQLTRPGFYQVQRRGQTVVTLAFNYPRRESELAAYSVTELRDLLGASHPNVRVLEPGAQVKALAEYRAGRSGQPLWRYCLLAALGCLLAEELVLRLGRRAALAA